MLEFRMIIWSGFSCPFSVPQGILCLQLVSYSCLSKSQFSEKRRIWKICSINVARQSKQDWYCKIKIPLCIKAVKENTKWLLKVGDCLKTAIVTLYYKLNFWLVDREIMFHCWKAIKILFTFFAHFLFCQNVCIINYLLYSSILSLEHSSLKPVFNSYLALWLVTDTGHILHDILNNTLYASI